jgi:hypothetical protein
MEEFEIEMLAKIDAGTLTEEDRGTLAYEMDEVEVIEGDNHRWQQEMETIFKIGDRHFSICWMSGLTECQENDFYNDPVEVEAITKTIKVTKWKPLKEK